MPEPRTLILYNEPVLPPDHPDYESEKEVLYSVGEVADSLEREGVPVARLGVAADPEALFAGLRATPHDVVFNLYEGTADQGGAEASVAGLLEWLRVPFTGSPAQAMLLARNKPVAKLVLAGAGVATPPYFVVDAGRCPPNKLGWPVIVKPGREDASVGIDQGAVVTNTRKLRDRVDYVRTHYGSPVLVEKFIPGREIHVTLVELEPDGGPTVLPFAEIRFEPDAKLWPIYSYDAKWKEDSREYELRPVDVPVTLPPDVTDRLSRACETAYRALGCRDYARVDARVTPDGEVYVLEANPNPSITSIMLTTGLEEIGWTDDRFLARMVRNAAARGGAVGVNPYGRPPAPQAASA